MNKLIKILLPASAIASIGLISGCSCTVSVDPQPISRDYLKIENGILKGFKDQYDTQPLPESSYALIVPKDVTAIDTMAFSNETEAKNKEKIVSLSFETDSLCTNMGGASFMGCVNLKTVVLPPNITAFGESIFSGCEKLTTIDIRNVVGTISSGDWMAPMLESWPQVGKVVYNRDTQVEVATSLLATINAQPATGEPNEWTPDPQ